MDMRAVPTEWTVEMLDALPEDDQRYEIIDGVLHVSPAPSVWHQFVVGEIHGLLREYLRRFPAIGRPVMSPSDVWRGQRRHNRVQPDVFVARLTDGRLPEYPFRLDSLLLAAEVVSPGDPLYDYHVKRKLYLDGGVPEYWVFDPDARNVTRWRGRPDPGDVLSERMEWWPAGAESPLIIDLPRLFRDALD
jgi:Uma2 family endonuclease